VNLETDSKAKERNSASIMDWKWVYGSSTSMELAGFAALLKKATKETTKQAFSTVSVKDVKQT